MEQKNVNSNAWAKWHLMALLPLTNPVEQAVERAWKELADDSHFSAYGKEEMLEKVLDQKEIMDMLDEHNYYLSVVGDTQAAKYCGIHLLRTPHSEPTLALQCHPRTEKEAGA